MLHDLAMTMWRKLIGLGIVAHWSFSDGLAQTFEAVSVKPCDAAGIGGGGQGGRGWRSTSPIRIPREAAFQLRDGGRAHPVCLPGFRDGQRHSEQHLDTLPIKGGPAWIYSDRYQIEAKAEGTPPEER